MHRHPDASAFPARRSNVPRGGRTHFLLSAGWALALVLLPIGAAEESPQVRAIISKKLFLEVNQNDAQAALKVWARTIAAERGIAVNPTGRLVDGLPQLRQIVRERGADLVGLTIDEYEQIAPELRVTNLYVTAAGSEAEDRYVVVTRREKRPARLADLGSATLLIFGSPRMVLAEAWLDLELVRGGLRPVRRHFGSVQSQAKLTKVILPVFFGQAEAALVSRKGFATMRELNPQLGQQLRVIAESPPYIPMVMALSADMDPKLRAQVAANITEVHRATGGRQVLNLLQGDRIEEIEVARLAPSLALLAEHRRLGGAGAEGGAR